MSDDAHDGGAPGDPENRSDAAKSLFGKLSAHKASEQEQAEAHSILCRALAAIWVCTRHDFPHRVNPRRQGESWESRTASFKWGEYSQRWITEAMVPAAKALLALEDGRGTKAEEMIQYAPRGSYQPKLDREEYAQSVFLKVIAACRSGKDAEGLAKELEEVLDADRDGWENYHSYFEGAFYALDVLRRAGTDKRVSGGTDDAESQIICGRISGAAREAVEHTLEFLNQASNEWIPRLDLAGFGIPPTTLDQHWASNPDADVKRGQKRVEYRSDYVRAFVVRVWRPRGTQNRT